jgi:hypothetical protein
VPPVVETVRVTGTPASSGFFEAVKEVSEGSGFTLRVKVPLADAPIESFAKARTVNVPVTPGVHAME